jgi:hypothetical protein
VGQVEEPVLFLPVSVLPSGYMGSLAGMEEVRFVHMWQMMDVTQIEAATVRRKRVCDH